MKILVLAVAAISVLPLGESLQAQEVDTQVFCTLERTWNDAHLRGDTTALEDLWAEDLRIEVPGMSEMSKSEALEFWRTRRSNITVYRTADLRVQTHVDSVLVDGRLKRSRDFNGRAATDDWKFQKVYKMRDGRWRVTHYRAWLGESSATVPDNSLESAARGPGRRLGDCPNLGSQS